MKPAPFHYIAAQSVEHALSLLSQYGSDAKLIAGGQSLVPMMNFRLARPDWLIDISRLSDLARIESNDNSIRVGSLVRYVELQKSEAIRHSAPLLAQMLPHVAHAAIRNRGTIGGSICHADPAAEIPVAMLALDATFVIQGSRNTRKIEADAFFMAQMTTAIEPDEILTIVEIPAAQRDDVAGFSEFARRRGDFAIASAATVLRYSGDVVSDHVRIAIGGLSQRAQRANKAEAMLVGGKPTPELIENVADTACREVDAGSDLHATEDYRRSLIATQVKQALTAAVAQRNRSTGVKT